MKKSVIVTFIAAGLTAGFAFAATVDDFEAKPAITVYQAEAAGATITFEAAPEAKGLSAKIAWTKIPPKGNMHITWPDATRPVLAFDAAGDVGGAIKFKVWIENPKAVRKFEIRIKDAKGESFTWGSDVTLEGKKWEEVTVELKPGTETSHKTDPRGSENNKFDSPVRLAHFGIVLRTDAEPGSIFIDDISFESAAPATQPSAAK